MTTTTGRGLAVTSPQLILTDDGIHCYAYSGGYGAVTNSVEWLRIRTSDFYVIGTFQLNTPVKADTPLDMSGLVAVIKFNDVIICQLVVNPQAAPNATNPTFATQELIIPPSTTMTVDVTSDAEDADDIGSAIFTGRVYGLDV